MKFELCKKMRYNIYRQILYCYINPKNKKRNGGNFYDRNNNETSTREIIQEQRNVSWIKQ